MFKKEKIILGTRGSALAVAQSNQFAESLKKTHSHLSIEIKKIITSGDRIQDRFLNEVGGKGLFVKEIEEALLNGEIDLAVHSLKDVPSILPEALTLGCFPKREEPQDVLLTLSRYSIDTLPAASVVGTASLRRQIQLKIFNSSLQFKMLRGNIDTRLRRLQAQEFEGIVLAKAGMKRLGLDLSLAVDLPIIPSPGQGTLGIEVRKEDEVIQKILQPLHDPITHTISLAEREVMAQLGGGCNLPLGVLGEKMEKQLKLSAFVSDLDGKKVIQDFQVGEFDNPIEIANQLVEKLKMQGAQSLS